MSINLTDRAGHYVRQPEGYKAFVPKRLPPEPPIAIDDEMWALLSQADQAVGRLDGSTEGLPNPNLFVAMYVRKEAVLSSQIEGTQASLVDLLEYQAQVMKAGADRDVVEVVNYVTAMNHGLARLTELPLSLRLIREIHEKLLTEVRGDDLSPGNFRTSQNWVGPPGCTLVQASYIPPPPHEMHRALDNLEKFLHDPAPKPLLIKVGLVHAQFETIHPFLDGNGRVGRLLITFLLCQQGALKRPLLYLSHYFKQNRSEYYGRLQAIRDEGDWEGWIKFFLRGVHEVAQEATVTARRVVNLREEHQTLIRQRLGNGAGRALALLETLFRQPLVDVHLVAETTSLAFGNANTLVRRLSDLGVLKEVTGKKRNRLFSYQPYVALFTQPDKP